MVTKLITVMVMMLVMVMGGVEGMKEGENTTAKESAQNLTIFQRVSVEGMLQLLKVAKTAEPNSCWCYDPNTPPEPLSHITLPLLALPASPCPVRIPNHHLSKVLKMTCKAGYNHCCLKRGSELERNDLGPAWEGMKVSKNNDTVALGHLERLVDTLADTLTPKGQGVTFPVHRQAPTTKANPLYNMDLPTLIMPPNKHKTGATKASTQNPDLLAVFQAAAQLLLGQKMSGKPGSLILVPSQNKTQDGSGDLGVLSTVKKLLENGTVGKLVGEGSKRLNRDTEVAENIGVVGLHDREIEKIGKESQRLKRDIEVAEKDNKIASLGVREIEMTEEESQRLKRDTEVAKNYNKIASLSDREVDMTDMESQRLKRSKIGLGWKNIDMIGRERQHLKRRETVNQHAKGTDMTERKIHRSKRDTKLTENDIEVSGSQDTQIGVNPAGVDDLFEKGEFALSYDQLGWFSKVVEVAVDGSLMIGIVVVTLLATGSLLNTVLPWVTNSCVVCGLIGYANTVAKEKDGL